MRGEHKGRMALKEEKVQAQKKSQKCQPCRNRNRQCDYNRPVCGTCILRDLRCVYKVGFIITHVQSLWLTTFLANETPFAPSTETDAPTPTESSSTSISTHTPESQNNAIVPPSGEQESDRTKKRKRAVSKHDEEEQEEEVEVEEPGPKRHRRRRRVVLSSGDEEEEEKIVKGFYMG